MCSFFCRRKIFFTNSEYILYLSVFVYAQMIINSHQHSCLQSCKYALLVRNTSSTTKYAVFRIIIIIQTFKYIFQRPEQRGEGTSKGGQRLEDRKYEEVSLVQKEEGGQNNEVREGYIQRLERRVKAVECLSRGQREVGC